MPTATEHILNTLGILQTSGLFSQNNVYDVIGCKNAALNLPDILTSLSLSKLLNQENFNAIIEQKNIFPQLKKALEILSANDMLNQANFDVVTTTHTFPDTAASNLVVLQQASILTTANLNFIKSLNLYSDSIGHILVHLHEAKLDTPENRVGLKNCAAPIPLLRIIKSLQVANILTQANFDCVKEANECTYPLSKILEKIWEIYTNTTLPAQPLLTQNQFNWLLQLNHAIIFPISERFETIPSNISHQQFKDYVKRLTPNIRFFLQGNCDLRQDRHSTYTASVHSSVTASIQKLMARYEQELTEDNINKLLGKLKQFYANPNRFQQVITTLFAWLFPSLRNNSNLSKFKLSAARRCLDRITDPAFIDPIEQHSQVTIRQLTALFWLVIHDDGQRLGSLRDAKDQLTEALYEIQRGYNLSVTGEDDKKADSLICRNGTINKLLEKLQGIHPDVEIIILNQTLASAKLPIVVKEEAYAYLRQQQNTFSSSNTYSALIAKLELNGVSAIWDSIITKLSNRLFSEFHDLYENSKENAKFKELIACGIYVDLGDLSNFKPRTPQPIARSTSSNILFFENQSTLKEETLIPEMRNSL